MVKRLSHKNVKDGLIRKTLILLIAILVFLLLMLLLNPNFHDSRSNLTDINSELPSDNYEEKLDAINISDELIPHLPLKSSKDSTETHSEPSPEERSSLSTELSSDDDASEEFPTALLPPSVDKGKPKLIIVIDDLGYNLEGLELFLKIPVSMTFAVLPQLAYSTESAQRIIDAGQELILHLPMESQSGQDPGPGTLLSNMNDAELRSLIEENSATVPGIVGLNNHMGSKGTEDERIMSQVFDYVGEHSLFFLDSLTTPKSVASGLLKEYNVPLVDRDLFLDNDTNPSSIIAVLKEGMHIAQEQGYAVLIGHVWTRELAEILLEYKNSIIDAGYEFSTLQSVFQEGE